MIIWRSILKVFEQVRGQICHNWTPWGCMCQSHRRMNFGTRTYTQGCYWPTMKRDVENYVKKCDWFQWHAPILCVPSEAFNPVTSPCLFAQWEMDIVRLLPIGVAQKKFLLVTTDYFSKWVETKAYASIKDKDVSKFVWKNIVCRFKIPWVIVRNNGPRFDSAIFRMFCSKLNIKNLCSTPCYP